MKKSRVLLFSNQGLSPLHQGIEMELIEELILKQKEIVVINCEKATKSCYFNPTGNPIACAICEGRSKNLHKTIDYKDIKFSNLPNVKIDKIAENYNVKTTSEIELWEYKGVNFGRGVLSSVISLKRDYDVQKDEVLELIKSETKVALRALLGFEKLITIYQPDEVYIFNGRFSESYPMVKYCSTHNIRFNTFEVGATKHKYEIYENALPHSIIARKKNLESLWNNADKFKTQLAKDWFEQKTKGTNQDDKNYIASQTKSLLPRDFNTTLTNIGIFNSSEDEMKTIEEWQHEIYSTQNEAIAKIIKYFEHNSSYRFYLRMHPNLVNLDNTQVKEIKDFTFENLIIIEPDDPVDTYHLMKNCDIVISFGSTIGIEATYSRKISIMLGKSFYSGMDAVFEPQSYDELFSLINNFKQLSPKPIENTYPYAYYVSNRGKEFKNFTYKGKHESLYKGILIKRFYFKTYVLMFNYLFTIPFWISKFKILYHRYPKIADLKILKL